VFTSKAAVANAIGTDHFLCELRWPVVSTACEHEDLIKLQWLDTAAARAWSVLEHVVIPVAVSRFDSGLAYQRVRTVEQVR